MPGLSFLDLAYGRLGIDPVEAGVRLVDGHEFATAAAGERGPMLVAHAHAPWVLSDIKLAVDGPGSDEVVVLQRLGLPDEEVPTVRWEDLDRSVAPDHLTCLYVPHVAEPVGTELVRFHGIVRRLREECPWDRQQTHQSLTRYAVEEVYELIEAIGRLDGSGAADEALEEELGDVLLQVFLHSAIAEQEGRFSIADVAAGISEKMVRRHPHVFGSTTVSGADQVAWNWEAIKAAEKGVSGGHGVRTSSVDGVPGRPAGPRLRPRAVRPGRPRRASTGTCPRGRSTRWPRSWTRCARPSTTRPPWVPRSATCCSPPSTWPATAAWTRRPPCGRPRPSSAGASRPARPSPPSGQIDTRTAGLPVLDALWDEVKDAEPRP